VDEHRDVIGGALLASATAFLAAAATVLGTNQKQHLFSPAVLFLALLGAACLVAALYVFGAHHKLAERAGLSRDEEIKATFQFNGEHLIVGIVNERATMRDAGINVLVPQRCRRIMRMVTAVKPAVGDLIGTSESLEPDGEPSIYWSEKQLHILGGGNSTLLYFRVLCGPGEYPIRLKLYDDADGPRRADILGTFVVPSPPIDQERRGKALASTLDLLERNRLPLVEACGRGHYWPADESCLRQPNLEVIRRQLDSKGADAKLFPLIREAFEETSRIAELVAERSGSEPEVQDSDRVERALTCISFARIYGAQALEELPQ
jgi:hypothetical protein